MQHLSQPCDLFSQRVISLGVRRRFFVLPMGGDPKLRVFMHIMRTNLNFQRLSGRASYSRVQRLVHIALRISDVVIELLGYVRPKCMHHAERRAAVRNRANENAHGPNIVKVGKLHICVAHFSPDAAEMLGSPANLPAQTRSAKFTHQLMDDG
jgi:hypothetical protein